MSHVVIAGGGPIGLYTAILLIQTNPSLEVTVLDGRLHSFDRPGVIAPSALSAMQVRLTTLDVSFAGCTPPALYIMDLQKTLLKYANELGIHLIDKDFFQIEPSGLIHMKNRGEVDTEILGGRCHLLIDCTGERRALIKEPIPIAENPLPYHFIAYVDVDADNALLMAPQHKTPPSIEEMAAFRRRTGWQEFVEPTIDKRHWDKPRHPTASGGGAGYCLYFEAPKMIAEAEQSRQLEYLSELLALKQGHLVRFSHSPDRGAFNAFEVQPSKLKKKCIDLNGIPAVSLGDAMIISLNTISDGFPRNTSHDH